MHKTKQNSKIMTYTELEKLHQHASDLLELMSTARRRIELRQDMSKNDLFPYIGQHWGQRAEDTRQALKRLERSYLAVITKIQKGLS